MDQLKKALRAVMPWYMAASAGLTAVLLASQVEIGDLFVRAMAGALSLPKVLGVVSAGTLFVLAFGVVLVVLYELEEIFLEWAEIADGDAGRDLWAHRFRRWLLGD